jgi:hypothetical protein
VIFEGLLADSEASEDGTLIKGVLLCGNRSLNNYEIPSEAFGDETRTKQLYENCHIYLDHNVEVGPSRSSAELAGVVTNVRLDKGRPRGDILLNDNAAGQEFKKLYDFTKRAEKHGAKVKNLGMSHVARYEFESKQRTRVSRVLEVFSVDLVIRPATTQSLFESVQRMDELKGLTDELNQLRGERDQLKLDLKSEKEAHSALQTKHNELQAESTKKALELDGLKAEKAIAERKGLILEGLKAAGLDTADTDVCSEAFMDTLAGEANAEKRANLIKDRAGLIAKAKAAGPTSTERKEGDKSFSTTKALETLSFS